MGDSLKVHLSMLKKNGGFFVCFFPRDDHMQYYVCWNLSYLNEEQMHSCVSEIKLGKKKIRLLYSSCHLITFFIYVEL